MQIGGFTLEAHDQQCNDAGMSQPSTSATSAPVVLGDAELASILQGVPQPVWVVNADGTVAYANPASVSVLGYRSATELAGRSSHGTVHYRRPDGSPYPMEECPMLAPRVTGLPGQGDEEWFVRQDGSMFPVAWWSAPIVLPTGRGAVLSFTDLTEQHANAEVRRERDVARLRESEARAAQRRLVDNTTAVRRQIASNLHDGVQQNLVALMMTLQLLSEQLPVDDEPRRLAAAAKLQAQTAVEELRDVAAGLHPATLARSGLPAAITALSRRAPLPVTVVTELRDRLPEAVEANLYFIVAEGLTNAFKHAQARQVSIRLAETDDAIDVELVDDGVGGAEMAVGAGLVGLHDRVGALDGHLTIDSPAGHGTRLTATIPTHNLHRS
ncbi:MAG TPA: histidine kinase [Propionibacteriaceae bacterium]|nr:histidine kinase [Propionibacteriaceae bacterium]